MEGQEEENKEKLIDGKKEIEIVKIYCLARALMMHRYAKIEIGEFVGIIERCDEKEDESRKLNSEAVNFIKAFFGVR